MKIRRKILANLLVIVVGMYALVAGIAQLVIISSYDRLEASYMERNVARVGNAIDDRLSRLGATLHDWSSWTETYEYLAGRNPGYVQANLQDATVASLRINLIAAVPLGGGAPYVKAVDLATGAAMPPPAGVEALWAADSPLIVDASMGARTGLFPLDDMILLVAARPALTSEGIGPSTGTLIMARFFDRRELDDLSHVVRLPLELYRIGEDGAAAGIDGTPAGALDVEHGAIRKPSRSAIEGYARIPDLTGRGSIVLKASSSRDISESGRATVRYFLIATSLLGAVAGAMVWILLRRVVIDPLGSLNADVAGIELSRDLSRRIEPPGDDEFRDLAAAVNTMLEALERSQAELRTAQRDQALGQLAGGTAHEFNNILAVIQGSLEMLMDGAEARPADAALLRRAYRAGQRGKEIVGQVLEFSKKTGQGLSPASLPTMVRAALDLVQPLVPPSVELKAELGRETRPILANPLQIEQIVLNLCRNALDAIGDAPGTLTVSVDDRGGPDDPVTLLVADTGAGIPASIGDRIFDPFFTTKKVGGGTGLGLSLVRGFVQQHGGTVSFASEAGKGASFSLAFPAADGAAAVSRPGRVLIVVPDPSEYRLHLLALEASGYSVGVASDPGEARRRLGSDSAPYDVILVDSDAADGGALAFCRELSENRPGTRVVLLKKPADDPSGELLASSGVSEAIDKPLTVRGFLEIL